MQPRDESELEDGSHGAFGAADGTSSRAHGAAPESDLGRWNSGVTGNIVCGQQCEIANAKWLRVIKLFGRTVIAVVMSQVTTSWNVGR